MEQPMQKSKIIQIIDPTPSSSSVSNFSYQNDVEECIEIPDNSRNTTDSQDFRSEYVFKRNFSKSQPLRLSDDNEKLKLLRLDCKSFKSEARTEGTHWTEDPDDLESPENSSPENSPSRNPRNFDISPAKRTKRGTLGGMSGCGGKNGRYLYQVFPGDSKYCCKGMCMTGAEKDCAVAPNLSFAHCGVIGLAVVMPLTVGLWNTIPFIKERYFGNHDNNGNNSNNSGKTNESESQHSNTYDAVMLFFWATYLTSLLLLYGVAYTDPGIIPRREIILQIPGEREKLKKLLGYDLLGIGDPTGIPEIDIRDMVPASLRCKGFRWCRTCHVIRPPRSAHCPDCDNCVLKFDHHCPFLNNCIGQRNYAFFTGYITSVIVLAVSMVILLAHNGVLAHNDKEKNNPLNNGIDSMMDGGNINKNLKHTESHDSKNADPNDPAAKLTAGGMVLLVLKWGFIVFICGALLMVCALWCYHIYLMCTGQTSKEHQKGLTPGGEDVTNDVDVCAKRGAKLLNPMTWIPFPERLQEGYISRTADMARDTNFSTVNNDNSNENSTSDNNTSDSNKNKRSSNREQQRQPLLSEGGHSKVLTYNTSDYYLSQANSKSSRSNRNYNGQIDSDITTDSDVEMARLDVPGSKNNNNSRHGDLSSVASEPRSYSSRNPAEGMHNKDDGSSTTNSKDNKVSTNNTRDFETVRTCETQNTRTSGNLVVVQGEQIIQKEGAHKSAAEFIEEAEESINEANPFN